MKTLLFTFFCVSMTTIITAQADTMKQANYPYPVHYAELSDTLKVAYLDEGQGAQTLIMIHGLGSYAPAWWKLMEELQQDYRCVALDLPGYGKSSTGDYPFSMAFFAEAVGGLIQHLELDEVVLVGHSMGGQIAMTMVLEEVAPISQLILIAPAGLETFTEKDKAFFRQLMTPEAVAATSPEQIRTNFAINFHQMQFPEDAEFMYEDRMLLRADSVAYQAYCNMIPQCVAGMLEAPVFEQLPAIKQATQVIYGKGDLLIPNKLLHPELTVEKVAEAGTEAMANAQLQLIEACGHFVQWECAAAVAKIIKNHLK